MTPQFHPHLVNGPSGDPALFVDFLHERRALLFDIGEIGALPPRKILRISHVFVSHTHIDHFIGFDHLVRICLGREKRIHLYGPPEFVERVQHRLAAYTWNLVENYPTDFTVVATELHPDGAALSAEFHCVRRFQQEGERSWRVEEGIIADEQNFRVRTLCLDHRTPSLAFALEEKQHVNIMKNRLEELGLPVGPWLAELKQATLRGDCLETPIQVRWREGGVLRERVMALGELKESVVRVVPGQKIAYVTDAAFSEKNAERIVSLAKGADYLFIESTFLDVEKEQAAVKCHLTARQAGSLGRAAGAVRVVPFHFSARYQGMGELLERELAEAFSDGD